jgi:hypothetical protein
MPRSVVNRALFQDTASYSFRQRFAAVRRPAWPKLPALPCSLRVGDESCPSCSRRQPQTVTKPERRQRALTTQSEISISWVGRATARQSVCCGAVFMIHLELTPSRSWPVCFLPESRLGGDQTFSSTFRYLATWHLYDEPRFAIVMCSRHVATLPGPLGLLSSLPMRPRELASSLRSTICSRKCHFCSKASR